MLTAPIGDSIIEHSGHTPQRGSLSIAFPLLLLLLPPRIILFSLDSRYISAVITSFLTIGCEQRENVIGPVEKLEC